MPPIQLFLRSVVVTLLILAVAFLGYGISAPWAHAVGVDGDLYLAHAPRGATGVGVAEIACLLVSTLLAVTSSQSRAWALVSAIVGVVGLIFVRVAHLDAQGATHARALAAVGFALGAIGCIVTACLPADPTSCETPVHDEDGTAVSRARLAARGDGSRPRARA